MSSLTAAAESAPPPPGTVWETRESWQVVMCIGDLKMVIAQVKYRDDADLYARIAQESKHVQSTIVECVTITQAVPVELAGRPDYGGYVPPGTAKDAARRKAEREEAMRRDVHGEAEAWAWYVRQCKRHGLQLGSALPPRKTRKKVVRS